jgi:arylsulfatase A-like enzyme
LDPDNPIASLKYRWCVRAPWKLIVPHAPQLIDAEVELYDLGTDPTETHNLASQHPERVAQLYREIQNWWPISLRGSR